MSVYEENVGDSAGSIGCACLAGAVRSVVVLYLCPCFVFDVRLELLNILVDAQTNDTYFACPAFLFFQKHIVVMLHWSLTRRAPCRPEIEKDDFTFIMDNRSRSTYEFSANTDLVCSFDDSHLVTLADLTRDLAIECDVSGHFLQLCDKFVLLSLLSLLQVARNLQACINFCLCFPENSNVLT